MCFVISYFDDRLYAMKNLHLPVCNIGYAFVVTHLRFSHFKLVAFVLNTSLRD